MKELIDQLIKKYGCITKVAELYGISYQTLNNWKKNTYKTKQIVDFYEKAKKDISRK